MKRSKTPVTEIALLSLPRRLQGVDDQPVTFAFKLAELDILALLPVPDWLKNNRREPPLKRELPESGCSVDDATHSD